MYNFILIFNFFKKISHSWADKLQESKLCYNFCGYVTISEDFSCKDNADFLNCHWGV